MPDHEPQSPASFLASPDEALNAPAEEFLYVACLHEGTGVEAPDYLAIVDVDAGLGHLREGHPRAADAERRATSSTTTAGIAAARRCHGPERSHLIVPGFRSSRIHIVDVETTRAGRGSRRSSSPRRSSAQTGLHPAAHGALHAGRQRRDLDARRRRGRRPGRLRRSRREDVRDRAAGRTAAGVRRSTTTSGTSPARTSWSRSEWGEPNTYERRVQPGGRPGGKYGHRLHFWDLAERTLEQTIDLGEQRPHPARGAAGCTTRRPRRASSAPRSRARCGAGIAERRRGRRSRSSRSSRTRSRAGRSRCRG